MLISPKNRSVSLPLVLLCCMFFVACDSGVEVSQPDASVSDDDSGNGTTDPTNDDSEPGNSETDVQTNRGPIANPFGSAETVQTAANTSRLPVTQTNQAYTGSFDSQDSVFYRDSENRLLALVFEPGNLRSVRADIDNNTTAIQLQQFVHDSRQENNGLTVSAFSNKYLSAAIPVAESSFDVSSGGGITTLNSSLPIRINPNTNGLRPISVQSVQGIWTSVYRQCDSNEESCAAITKRIDVSNTAVNGWAGVFATDGTDLLPSDITGNIEQRGSVLGIEFRWNTYQYQGVLFVRENDPTRLYLLATTDSEIADERVLASTFVKLLDN